MHMRKIQDFLDVKITMKSYRKFHKAVLESLEVGRKTLSIILEQFLF